VKIGPVIDTEIALLIVKNKEKKEEIYASKIYSPVGKFAELVKKNLTIDFFFFNKLVFLQP